MKYLKISNKGILDSRLIFLMGGTTKREDSSKIGNFGTGLKYAISWLLSNNIVFKLFIDGHEVEFNIKHENIQGHTFSKIFVGGKDASMTTLLGSDWKPEYIVREIWANAKDEEDAINEITEDISAEEGRTEFYVQLVPDIAKVVDNWSIYFKESSDAIYESADGDFKLYKASDRPRVYKNGFLVWEHKEPKKCLFNYDIPDISINELRVVTYEPEFTIATELLKLDGKWSRYFLDNLSKKYHEWEYDYDSVFGYGRKLASLLKGQSIISQSSYEGFEKQGRDMSTFGYKVVPDSLFKTLTGHDPELSATMTCNKWSFVETEDKELKKMIDKAITILEYCKVYLVDRATIKYGIFADPQIYAQVNLETYEILFSETIKSKGLFTVMSTVLEENEHLKTKYADHSREFQQHFIDLYLTELLKRHSIEL